MRPLDFYHIVIRAIAILIVLITVHTNEVSAYPLEQTFSFTIKDLSNEPVAATLGINLNDTITGVIEVDSERLKIDRLYNRNVGLPPQLPSVTYDQSPNELGLFRHLDTVDHFRVQGGRITELILHDFFSDAYLFLTVTDMAFGFAGIFTGVSALNGSGIAHISMVPEPATIMLLGCGIMGIAVVGKRKRYRKH